MSKDFAHKLKTPIEYHGDGENQKAKAITLTAPSNKQRKHAAKLKQFFFQAIQGLQGDEKQQATGSEDVKSKGSDIIAVMMMSDVDANDVHEAFKGLITNGCALVDGKVPLNDELYNKLSFDDTETMLGDYLVNFLIPSL